MYETAGDLEKSCSFSNIG